MVVDVWFAALVMNFISTMTFPIRRVELQSRQQTFTAANVQLLCARHNLEKRDKIL